MNNYTILFLYGFTKREEGKRMLGFIDGKVNMRKALNLSLFYLLLLGFIVTSHTRFPNPDILPEKGGLSILIIYHPDSIMKNPEFLSNHYKHDVYRVTHLNMNTFNDEYPSLTIDSAPYYIFLDSKGIAYETSDIEAAEEFYESNVNMRRD